MESDFVVTQSESLEHTFYIFRDNGIEIKVIRKGNELFARWNLRPQEIEYLKNFNNLITQ